MAARSRAAALDMKRDEMAKHVASSKYLKPPWGACGVAQQSSLDRCPSAEANPDYSLSALQL
jgi:hypothetical protein